MLERIEKFPFIVVVLAYAGYLGFQYYTFALAPAGPVATQKGKIVLMQEELGKLKRKAEEAQNQSGPDNTKKNLASQLAKQIEELKAKIPVQAELPALIKLIVTEAKKAGVMVDRLEPGRRSANENYVQQELKFEGRGNYGQLISFVQKISQIQRPVKVGGFQLKPKVTSNASGVPLDIRMSLYTFQYSMSPEDAWLSGVQL